MERNWIKKIELVAFGDQFQIIVERVETIHSISKTSNFEKSETTN